MNINKLFLFFAMLPYHIVSSQHIGEDNTRFNDKIYQQETTAKDVKMVKVRNGEYKVWTKKVGSGKIRMLLLHGGPGTSPEYFFNFPQNLSKDYTIYFFSQLGTYFSDIPKDSTLYNLESFVEDVEEVRKSLNLDNFYLLGHSWGNYLAQAYAAKYQNHLKGIILCNNINANKEIVDDYTVQLYAAIMDEFTEYKKYSDSLRFGFTGEFTDFSSPNSLGNKIREKVWPEMLKRHYARLPEPLPENLTRSRIHSTGAFMKEIGFTQKVLAMDYDEFLIKIEKPVLLIGGKYDFIPPWYYAKMKDKLKKSPMVDICITNGGHFDMWDDSKNYFKAINDFVTTAQELLPH